MAEVDIYKRYIQHPDDWAFVRPLVHHAPQHVLPALFCAYLASWRHAAHHEPVPCKKDNAGRRAANTRLRVDSKNMMLGDKETRQRYARLVNQGPKISCASCQWCDMIGECSKRLDGPGNECAEWRADFS